MKKSTESIKYHVVSHPALFTRRQLGGVVQKGRKGE